MTKRITIDPITRIEGHLRVDVEIANVDGFNGASVLVGREIGRSNSLLRKRERSTEEKDAHKEKESKKSSTHTRLLGSHDNLIPEPVWWK